ncbi:MAG: hypothetical protein AAF485_18635 [Chloroflexota bacterium]
MRPTTDGGGSEETPKTESAQPEAPQGRAVEIRRGREASTQKGSKRPGGRAGETTETPLRESRKARRHVSSKGVLYQPIGGCPSNIWRPFAKFTPIQPA